MTASRAAFSSLIALMVGRHQRPLDRRDDALDPLIEMRGVALDLGRPFQRRHRQRRRALGRSRPRPGTGADRRPAYGFVEIVGTVDGGDRHGCLLRIICSRLSIFGLFKIRPLRAGFLIYRGYYPHYEQIKHNMVFRRSARCHGHQVVVSARRDLHRCDARGDFSGGVLGFPCRCINSL